MRALVLWCLLLGSAGSPTAGPALSLLPEGVQPFEAGLVHMGGLAVRCAEGRAHTACDRMAEGDLAIVRSALGRGPEVASDAQPRLQLDASASSVVIVSVCLPPAGDSEVLMQGLCSLAKSNFETYTQIHGYKLSFVEELLEGTAGRSPQWIKILALRAAVRDPANSYAFWMDADSLFMDLTKPISSLFPRGTAHMSFAGDYNCFLNSGHMMFRCGDWAESFLNATWGVYPSPLPWNDQSSMVYVLDGGLAHCRNRVNTTGCCGVACSHANGTGHCDESSWPDWQRSLDGQVKGVMR